MASTRKNRIVWGDAGWIPHHYGFCPNTAAWAHVCKYMKMGPEPYPEFKATTSLFKSKLDGKPVAIVTVGDFEPCVTADLLVHEAMHVWRDMREAIGEDKPSSEFEAYALQNITANLFNAYEKTRGQLFLRRRQTGQPHK